MAAESFDGAAAYIRRSVWIRYCSKLSTGDISRSPGRVQARSQALLKRKRVPPTIEAAVLMRCHRRCCLCFYLLSDAGIRKGQIAHLNGNPADNRLENLVWLCLDHHDEFDSRTSQSKGLTQIEVRKCRDKLVEHFATRNDSPRKPVSGDETVASPITEQRSKGRDRGRAWRNPPWNTPDHPQFFAYTSRNKIDGICLIERIDLPDGRIAIACIQVPGNPGNSVTNTVETICEQVCEQFEIPLERLVWLENYEHSDPEEWHRVIFRKWPPAHRLGDPEWLEMSDREWSKLRLRPRPHLTADGWEIGSKLEKLFPWPPDI